MAAWLVDGWVQGGAVYISGGAPSIFGSDFSGNQCGEQGGAAYIAGYGGASGGTIPENYNPAGTGGITRLANCVLRGNTAASEGGAVFVGGVSGNSQQDAILAHCTLTGNVSGIGVGGALYAAADVEYYNNLTWFNTPSLAQAIVDGTLTASGNNSEHPLPSESHPANVVPAFAFDGIHLRNSLTSGQITGLNYTAELYPGTFSYQLYDYDREIRTAAHMEPGCDSVKDTDGDGFPDWFEDYICLGSVAEGYCRRSKFFYLADHGTSSV